MMKHKNVVQREITRFRNHHLTEHDACGIVCVIEKDGKPSHENILRVLDALIKMEHRSGFIDGEGDGCGILCDIPRTLWAQKLLAAGKSGELAFDKRFAVGHIFIPRDLDREAVMADIRARLEAAGFALLCEEVDNVNPAVLGKNARKESPVFWQVALLAENVDRTRSLEANLFELHVAIEAAHRVHVASLSNHTVAYKVMGAAGILPKYFHDIGRPEFQSTVTIGHNRYSTNTLSNFFRVQPFTLLGHNGEINTITRLEEEAEMLGVPLVEGGSDSQNLNRTAETLIHRYNLTLFEAMEFLFPPIINEIKQLRPELQDLYAYIRETWGHFAQGPAGIVSRYKDECVFSVDALGLRPLWMVEDERALYFSSEQGLIPVTEMVAEPKPLAPGEKVGVQLLPEGGIRRFAHHELQEEVYRRLAQKVDFRGFRHRLDVGQPPAEVEHREPILDVTNNLYAAFGWEREQIQLAEQMAASGAEPIRSLGHDAPLAALARERQNIADYIKESVAVVTNPAIDREREMEHFSTRVVIGRRPTLATAEDRGDVLELPSPILLEGPLGQEAARRLGTWSFEEVLAHFAKVGGGVHTIGTFFVDGQSMRDALKAMADEAVEAVRAGATLILLDDSPCHQDGRYWIDPHLCLAAIDTALKQAEPGNGNLRRRAGIILRSGAIRSLHDLVLACGFGADAVSPYLLFATVSGGKNGEAAASVVNLYHALTKGIEKVISTLGVHELRGYTRQFASIGLRDEVAAVLGITNFLGSETAGTSFSDLEADSRKRYDDFHSNAAKPAKLFRLFPRIWKSIGQLAAGEIAYREYADKLENEERTNPIAIRHLADLNLEKARRERPPLDPREVDISVGEHSLPLIISSMSFGSQNEIAFRAYAEAAEQLNMISLNGEGGEIKDMLGKYLRTRGIQIASGRFGVNVELANAANIVEIKIGQGAKPGEGGHLPGSKVTAKIAAARNATIGSDLISPSNNHDIYSIEDLAQIIYEIKQANDRAKVAVKVPIVPNIGTIAVGIAKAGADFINLSGFDGGTGAARVHAIQHVGLPAEIGVKAAHNALIEAGLRDRVELWCDGGMRSGLDVVKMILLGANRVGFGTLAMVAIGCTTCRGCHLDTCHVGIATQIDSFEEAKEKGLRRFVPREFDRAVEGLKTFFTAVGEEVRRLTAELGFARTQDMVGRADLLVQTRGLERLDLRHLLTPMPMPDELRVAALREDEQPARLLVAAGAERAQLEAETYVSTDRPLRRTFRTVLSNARVMGGLYSCYRVRGRLDGSYRNLPEVTLTFEDGSVPGNGLAAFNAEGVNIRVRGGAQDGVGKMAFGGRVSILKAKNKHGVFLNGSVGKSFCYGAQKGLFIVQGNADARAGIRLSGADVVIGGELTEPVRDELGSIGARANIKGFAFEYMTNGRAVVLGDPGPWICSGMTGGVVYLRVIPEMGLDEAALRRRIAKGAKVELKPLDEKGKADIAELLGAYVEELKATDQHEKAEAIQRLIAEADRHFRMVVPVKLQADQSVATE